MLIMMVSSTARVNKGSLKYKHKVLIFAEFCSMLCSKDTRRKGSRIKNKEIQNKRKMFK